MSTEVSPKTLARRRKQMRLDKLRKMGKPATCFPHEYEEARNWIRYMHDGVGLSFNDMGNETGIISSHLIDIFHGNVKSITRRTYDRIMILQPRSPRDNGGWVEGTGTRRRLQALRCEGHSIETLMQITGWKSKERLRQFLRGEGINVHSPVRARVVQEYPRILAKSPEDFGTSHRTSAIAKSWARKAGFAPWHCWDDSTIDDPDAIAEWTGHCGTPRGYRIHSRDNIPPCGPCLATKRRSRDNHEKEKAD